MSATKTAKKTATDYKALIEADANAFSPELVAEYKSAGDAKARAAIRKIVTDNQNAAMSELDAHQAKFWMNTGNELKVDGPAKAESIPAHVALATRVHQLRLAAQYLVDGTATPDGMSEVDRDAFLELVNNEAHDGNVTNELRDAAMKLAGGKITRTTERRSVEACVQRAFDGAEVGSVLTIAAVRRGGVDTDGYLTSPGAIRARFDGKGIEGFELVAPTGDSPWSVRKTA